MTEDDRWALVEYLKSIPEEAGRVTPFGGPRLLLPSYHAVAQSGPFLVNLVELDIVPADLNKFIAAAKENGASAVKEPGCREFNIVVSQKDPNHIMTFEVYDNAAALDAHRATDRFKKYQATTKDMVAKSEVRQFSTIAMNAK